MKTNITIKDLEQMGITSIGSRLHPNRFFLPQVGEIDLYPPYRWEIILQSVYDAGFKMGELQGKERRSFEIRRLINNEF